MVIRSAAITLLLLAASHGNVVAQVGPGPVFERPTWLVGYVANAPHLLLGGTVAVLPDALGGWGLYLDAKTGVESPADDPSFATDRTVAQARSEDIFTGEESHWRSFNAAVVRAFRDDFIVYLGGGAAEERAFAEFLDESGQRGNFGYYIVEDESSGGWQANAMGGMYFRIMEHLALQFGVESTPVGLTVGVIGAF